MKRELRLNAYDCCGDPKQRRMMKTIAFRGADITVIVYDITDRNSFVYALDLIDHDVDKVTKVFLVGNKLDLKEYRKVSLKEGMEEAEERNVHNYVEVSASDHSQILEHGQNL